MIICDNLFYFPSFSPGRSRSQTRLTAWVSRSAASARLWSTLSGEVRDRCLHHLSCLSSSEKRASHHLTVITAQLASSCHASPFFFGGGGVRDLATRGPFSPLMLSMCLSWLFNGAAKTQNYLVITLHITKIPMYLFTFYSSILLGLFMALSTG